MCPCRWWTVGPPRKGAERLDLAERGLAEDGHRIGRWVLEIDRESGPVVGSLAKIDHIVVVEAEVVPVDL